MCIGCIAVKNKSALQLAKQIEYFWQHILSEILEIDKIYFKYYINNIEL